MSLVPLCPGKNMKEVMTAVKAIFFLSFSLLLATSPHSEPVVAAQKISRNDPEQMLQQATTQLLEISKAAQVYAKENRERYYTEVSGVLDQVMDIQYFARGVMATYASSRLYTSLKTDAEKAAFRDRVARFAIALKRVWMVKYADALLLFNGERIDLMKVPTGEGSGDRASLMQTVHADDGNTYVIRYSVHKIEDGSWLVANVIVEDINLGEIYRNQFAAAVENHKGDIDYVVDHWVELMINEQSGGAARGSAGTGK